MPITPYIPSADPQQTPDESYFWKALSLLSRPNAAIMGGVRAGVVGEDPVNAMYQGLVGNENYSGKDVLSAFGADPESMLTKIGGFGLDVINPLDPLNYIGLGELTKTGRAAKSLGSLAELAPEAARLGATIGEQARLGQRGLITFAGMPVVKGAPALDALGKAGSWVADSALGKTARGMFGGKYGKFASQAPIGDELTQDVININEAAQLPGNALTARSEQMLKPVSALKAREDTDLAETIAKMGRGEYSFEEATAKFVKPSEAGAERRQAAWQAAQDFYKYRSEALGPLDKTGVAAYASPEMGYLPRVASMTEPGKGMGPKVADEIRSKLSGPSANPFNYGLVQQSIEPPAYETLTDAGKAIWNSKSPEKWVEMFNPNSDMFDPKAVEGLASLRMTPVELNAMGKMSYNTRATTAFQSMVKDAADNLQYDSLIQQLKRQGVAVPWVDAIHAGDAVKTSGRVPFAKIDQGRWAKEPLAVPWDVTDAMGRLQEAMLPTPANASLGAMMNALVPDSFKNIKPIQWWKGMAIFGGGPSYFMRNFATGLVKNRVEGVALRNYGHTFTDLMGPLFMGTLDKSTVHLAQSGVELPAQRIMEEYVARAMAGGGIPDVDVFEGLTKADKLRKATFGWMQKANEQVEMAIRLPLVLQKVDETLVQAAKHGITGEHVLDAAFENAKKAVDKVHFDYTNLSPFEKKLRDWWVPFYAWTRFNIPHETVAMLTHPGKYMPFARAYYQGVEQSGMSREDMPQWLQNNFAIPIGKTEDGRTQYVDLTGFLPFMDVMSLAKIAVPFFQPGEQGIQVGQTDRQAMLSYIATHMNPLVTKAAEQALGKEFLSGREFSTTPSELFGVTVSPENANLINLMRPAMELDRLNPTAAGGLGGAAGAALGAYAGGPIGSIIGLGAGLAAGTAMAPDETGVFTQIGHALGTYTGERPHRNEPTPLSRATRTVFGMKTYAPQPDFQNMSMKEAKRQTRMYSYKMRKAIASGNTGEAMYYKGIVDRLQGQ